MIITKTIYTKKYIQYTKEMYKMKNGLIKHWEYEPLKIYVECPYCETKLTDEDSCCDDKMTITDGHICTCYECGQKFVAIEE